MRRVLLSVLLLLSLCAAFSAAAAEKGSRSFPVKIVAAPSHTPTAAVTASPAPTPTASPAPTQSAAPAETAAPTESIAPVETAAPVKTAAPTETVAPTPSPSPVPVEVLLSLAGDCTLGADEKTHSMPESYIGVMLANGNDYTYPLRYALPYFTADDFTLVNLEGILSDRAGLINTDLYLNFRGPKSYVNILTQSSVEGVSMSNNHALDYTIEGLRDCQANLDEAGVQWAYNDRYFTFERKGVKFAVFSFRRYYMEVYYQWLEEAISRVKRQEGVDFVIVCLHHGEEYEAKHNDHDQTRFAHHAIDYGADLVVGTHPHVLQGIEVYKNRLILYSLGNFSFGGNNRPFEASIPTAVMQVRLVFQKNALQSTQLTIHPFHATGTQPYSNYQPVPVTGAEAREVMDIIQSDTPFPLRPYQEGQGAVQDIIYAK